MAGETQLTLVGNLVEDPSLRYTSNGQAVVSFRVASTPRVKGQDGNWRDGESLFMSVNVWRQQAEHCAESLTRGMRVIVQGRLRQRSFETREGEKRTVYEVEADDVAPSLRNATAKVTKAQRQQGGGGFGQGTPSGGRQGGQRDPYGGQGSQPADDPWATSGQQSGYSDDPPF